MKKIVLIVLAIALVLIPAVVFANGVIKGKAKFKFEESEGVLTITGKGKGFEPGESYISLVYGIGSLTKGPEACEPAGGLADDLMLVGFWDVSPDGKATLIEAGPASGASLADIGTISVRREAILFSSGRPPGFPEEIDEGPVVVFPVEACGAVE